MKELITQAVRESLCEQFAYETYNSHLYLCIAGFLKNKGLDNIAKKFEHQHKEEFDHAKMIYDFVTDLGADFYIPEILAVDSSFDDKTLLDIAEIYLDKEISTTTSLNDIKNMAIEDSLPVTEEFIRDMIRLQRDEYKESTDFMDKAKIIGGDWKSAMIWDLNIGG